jgi:protein PhnA
MSVWLRWKASARTSSGIVNRAHVNCAGAFFAPLFGRRASERRMTRFPECPQCKSSLTYEDGDLYICPECAHEWSKNATQQSDSTDQARVIRDAVGNELRDGDAVTVIKDLKVKGSSLVVKMGTKVKNIRLVDGDHDIDCKIDGIGAMQLKSEFVKKA